jgi:hypothetical protein
MTRENMYHLLAAVIAVISFSTVHVHVSEYFDYHGPLNLAIACLLCGCASVLALGLRPVTIAVGIVLLLASAVTTMINGFLFGFYD